MNRGLQKPARPPHAPRLKELQKTPVPAKVFLLVGVYEPLVVRRQVGLRQELEAREVQRGYGEAFLGRVRRHVVLLPKVGHQPENPVELPPHGVDARVGCMVSRTWGGVRQQALPRQRCAVVAVQVKQRVQDRGPAPGRTGDEYRVSDWLIADFRSFGERALNAMAGVCRPLQGAAHGELSEQAQPCLRFERADERIEAFPWVRIGKRESTDPFGTVEHPSCMQGKRGEPASFEQRSHRIRGPEHGGMPNANRRGGHSGQLLELGGDRHVALYLDLSRCHGHERLDLLALELPVGVERHPHGAVGFH